MLIPQKMKPTVKKSCNSTVFDLPTYGTELIIQSWTKATVYQLDFQNLFPIKRLVHSLYIFRIIIRIKFYYVIATSHYSLGLRA